MTEWFRVKDPETGHEYTTAVPQEGQEILDKPAVGRDDRPLPATINVNPAPSRGKKAGTSGSTDEA